MQASFFFFNSNSPVLSQYIELTLCLVAIEVSMTHMGSWHRCPVNTLVGFIQGVAISVDRPLNVLLVSFHKSKLQLISCYFFYGGVQVF